MSAEAVYITKSWRWSGPVTNGWKALATLVISDIGIETRRQAIISHASGVVPNINETMVFGCEPGTEKADYDNVLGRWGGSVSPRQLFPGAAVHVDAGVEELWNES